MPVYKEKERDTWYVSTYFRDYENVLHKKTKRGFTSRQLAARWEIEFLAKKSRTTYKKFCDFWENYKEDVKPRVRCNTWEMKELIVKTKILPFFGDMKLSEIRPRDIIKWQNMLIELKKADGGEYSNTYYKTVQAQLSAIFNHAVRFYDLEYNPVKSVLPIQNGKPQDFKYWTVEEYRKFSKEAMAEPYIYYAFEILYWCGIREGELFALTKADFDFENGTLSINKTLTVINGEVIINKPKTVKSIRTVTMPLTLLRALEAFVDDMNIVAGKRIFNISKTKLYERFKKYTALAGVPPIRIHDLRHSHISLLIHLGFSAVAIGERVGHKSERITYYYAHLFPGVQEMVAMRLDEMR